MAGEVVTAALMNTHIRDNLNMVTGIPAAFTTGLNAATTQPTLGTGSSVSGSWLQVGKLVHYRVSIISGSSGTVPGSGTYQFGLPVTPAVTNLSPVGQIVISDTTTVIGIGHVAWDSGTTAHAYVIGTTGGTSLVTHTLFNVANNRRYLVTGSYEAA